MAKEKAGSVAVSTVRRFGKSRLLSDFAALVQEDRSNTAAVLAYVGEIDRRKLYLEHAYPSMFAFCTRHFGMSESIAAKRIRAGRAACAFPCILSMIRTGELHLSGVHQLAGHLTKANHERVLRRAKHRSMREIDELIAEISPRPDGRSVVCALPETDAVGGEQPPPLGAEVESTATGMDVSPPASSDVAARVSDSPRLSAPMPASSVKNLTIPLSPRRYRLHVTIGQEARDTLEELQNLLSHQIPNGDPALIIERALEVLLINAKKTRFAATDKPRSRKQTKSTAKTRSIPVKVRRAVYERDGGRCAFVDGNGRRCGSAWQIEFHHSVPYGRDGPNTVDNIELRCRAHNQYEAELEYGKTFMEHRRRSA